MALSERLAILIDANGAGAVKEFERVGKSAERELGKTQDRTQQIGASLTQVGAVMIGVGAVLVGGAIKAAQAFEEDQMAVMRLQNTVEKMPMLAGASTEAFLEQASALQQVTKFADEQTISAQAMLGTFNLTEDQILSLTPLVQDYAAKFKVDLVDASKQVGKAMMGQRGALQRNGVTIDENLYKTDRYAAVMKALREQAGGFAEGEAKTMSGQLEILRNRFSDVIELVGQGAAGAFGIMLTPVKGVLGLFEKLPPAVGQTVGGFAAFGGVATIVAGAASVVVGQVMLMKERFIAAYDAAKRFYTWVKAQSLATVGTVAGVAAAVVGLYVAFDFLSKKLVDNKFNVFKEDSDQARRSLEHFVETGEWFASMSDALARLRVNMNDTDAGARGMADTFLSVGSTGNAAADAALRLGSLLDNFMDKNAAEAVADDFKQLDNELKGMAQESLPKAKVAFDGVVEQLGLQGLSMDELEQRFPGFIQMYDDSAQATGDLSFETQQLVEALQEQRDALDALFDPVFAAIKAQDSLREAQAKASGAQMELAAAQAAYDEALRNNPPTSDAVQQAAWRLMAAQEGVADASIGAVEAAKRYDSALLALASQSAQAGESTQQFEDKLRTWKDQGWITEDQAERMRIKFYELTDQANRVPGTITMTIQSNIGDIVTDMETLLRGFNALPPGPWNYETAWRAAHGLPIQGGYLGRAVVSRKPYLVGEEGPELFIPDGSGRVIPEDRTRRMLGSGAQPSAAGTTSTKGGDVNVYVNQTNADPYQIGRELLWNLKVSG